MVLSFAVYPPCMEKKIGAVEYVKTLELMRKFWNIIYYGFARYLPKSTMPIVGRFALLLRNRCAHGMFAECRSFVNMESGAYVGSGANFRVLGVCGIGKDFVCHNRFVTIHGGLLMGENVLFQGGAYIR